MTKYKSSVGNAGLKHDPEENLIGELVKVWTGRRRGRCDSNRDKGGDSSGSLRTHSETSNSYHWKRLFAEEVRHATPFRRSQEEEC